jgi:hypothetical protein
MGHLHLAYQISIPLGSKDISQSFIVFFKIDSSPKLRSLGQNSSYQQKCFFIVHLYLKYQSPKVLGSKDIAMVTIFQNLVKVQDQSH